MTPALSDQQTPRCQNLTARDAEIILHPLSRISSVDGERSNLCLKRLPAVVHRGTVTVIFLHVPKTAGTSLDTGWLKPRFANERRYCETDLFEQDRLVGRHVFAEMEHISKHFNFRYRDVFRFY